MLEHAYTMLGNGKWVMLECEQAKKYYNEITYQYNYYNKFSSTLSVAFICMEITYDPFLNRFLKKPEPVGEGFTILGPVDTAGSVHIPDDVLAGGSLLVAALMLLPCRLIAVFCVPMTDAGAKRDAVTDDGEASAVETVPESCLNGSFAVPEGTSIVSEAAMAPRDLLEGTLDRSSAEDLLRMDRWSRGRRGDIKRSPWEVKDAELCPAVTTIAFIQPRLSTLYDAARATSSASTRGSDSRRRLDMPPWRGLSIWDAAAAAGAIGGGGTRRGDMMNALKTVVQTDCPPLRGVTAGSMGGGGDGKHEEPRRERGVRPAPTGTAAAVLVAGWGAFSVS